MSLAKNLVEFSSNKQSAHFYKIEKAPQEVFWRWKVVSLFASS
jgi:hypothetical protein